MEASARVTGIFSSILISYQRCRPNRRRLSANRPPSAQTRRISVAPSWAAISSKPRVARLDTSPRVKAPTFSGCDWSSNSILYPTPYGNVVAATGIIPVFPGGLADAIPGNRSLLRTKRKVRP